MSLSAEEKAELLDEVDIERSRRTPEAFAEYVMCDEETGEPFKLADFHREWHELMTNESRVLLEGPREHGKSGTIVSRALWELGNNPNIRIKIISSSDEMAKKRLSSIIQYIERSERLRKVFPNLKPADKESWTKRAIYVPRESMSGEPSVEAYGILSSSSGSRADLLFLDDIVDAKNSIIQPALQETIRRVLFDNVLNFLPAGGGRAIYICTPWTMSDVTNDLKTLDAWFKWRRPVTVDNPIWPERWSRESLAKRKEELPLRSWQRQFELVVIAEEGATFSHRRIEACSKTEQYTPKDDTKFYAGVDLAISQSKKKQRSWFVIEVGAADGPKDKHIVETIRRRGLTLNITPVTIKPQSALSIKDVNIVLGNSSVGVQIGKDLQRNRVRTRLFVYPVRMLLLRIDCAVIVKIPPPG